MENLQGGTIALSHRYDVQELHAHRGAYSLYEGIQDPFDKPIWIHVYALEDMLEASVDLTQSVRERTLDSSRLNIDGALATLDHGELDDGVPFVITERAEAPTLSTVLYHHGPRTEEETLALVERLAEILERAHARGVAHGGVDVSSIYVPEERLGRAVLGHFGLNFTLSELRSLPDVLPRHTSLRPLPPEIFALASDEDISFAPEHDIYALAAVAYECLVGFHPFFPEDVDPTEGIQHISTRPARPLEDMGVPGAISEVIAQALSPDPSSRHATPRAFYQALVEASSATTAPQAARADAPPEPDAATPEPPEVEAWVSDRRSTILGAVLLFAIVTNLGWLVWTASTPEARPTRGLTVLPSGLQLDTSPGEADITALRENREIPMGPTPQIIDPAVPTGESLRLRLRKEGYEDVLLDIRKRDDGQDVTIFLEQLD